MLIGTTIDNLTKRVNSVVLGQTNFNDQQILESILKVAIYGGSISVQQEDGTVESFQLHDAEDKSDGTSL